MAVRFMKLGIGEEVRVSWTRREIVVSGFISMFCGV